MSHPSRAGRLTLALAACGAVLGHVAIASGSRLGLLVHPSEIGAVLVGVQALAGGVFGAVVVPLIAWTLLRHVPLGAVLLALPLGAAVGTAVEWSVLHQSTFGGAAVGTLGAAAVVARWPWRRGAMPAIVGAPESPLKALGGARGGTDVAGRRVAASRAHRAP